jgi:hypothetical protein
MIADHYAGVAALLPSDMTVYKGDVPGTPTYPYVVLWGDGGTADTEALSDDPTTFTLKVYATVAGLSFDSAAIILQRVRTALNRARPTVPNRVTHRMVQTPQMPIQADLSVTIPGIGHPFYAVDQYDLISDPK